MTAPLEAIAEALRLARAKQDAVRTSEAEEARLRVQAQAQGAESQALEEAREAEDARKVRGGQAPSQRPRPGLKAARLAEASKTAADAVAAERPALREAAAAARARVTDAALGFMRSERDAAQEAAQAALRTALAEPLSRLIAAEVVKTALIGDRYGFDAQAHPPTSLWSSAIAARALLANLPSRLAPYGFAAEVEEAADRLARETLARIGASHVDR